jgi:hypothetical protein
LTEEELEPDMVLKLREAPVQHEDGRVRGGDNFDFFRQLGEGLEWELQDGDWYETCPDFDELEEEKRKKAIQKAAEAKAKAGSKQGASTPKGNRKRKRADPVPTPVADDDDGDDDE